MMIHDHYMPFKQFVCYSHYLCVCHGNIVSIYNRLTNEWEKHFLFNKSSNSDLDSNYSGFTFDFRETNDIACCFLNEYKGVEEICIYFQDGSFKSIYLDEQTGWMQKNL